MRIPMQYTVSCDQGELKAIDNQVTDESLASSQPPTPVKVKLGWQARIIEGVAQRSHTNKKL